MVRGSVLEVRAAEKLQGDGYLVHRTHNSPAIFTRGRWVSSHNNDILGAFDLLAISEEHLARLIQVTTLSNVSHRRKKVDSLITINPNNIFVEVWAWTRKGRTGQFRKWRRVQVGTWMEL
jgi:hypothetical protein